MKHASMKRIVTLTALTLILCGCGIRQNLKPLAGTASPMKAETEGAAQTPEQLMTPDSQAKPKRSDEQLKRSEERREDKFDLPPA
jgi:uncharacterized lipoprotein NlpE involved in copper resistance